MSLPFPRRLRLMLGAATAAAIALVGGCYSPSIKDGTLSCASGQRCPRGFVCLQQLCYRGAADATASDVSAERGAPPDGGPAGVHDAAPDMARDAAPDMARDAAPDMAPDLAPDMAPDLAPDIATSDGPSEPTGGGRGLGASCDAGSQCASGVCADGVCCQNACGGRCEACNLQGNVGTCAPIAAGDPSPNGHSACPTDTPESCGRDGTCDGNRGCRLRRAGASCGTASCSGGTATPAPTCDGTGQCVPSTPRACAPYACNGNTGCFGSCTASTQCQAPNSCVSGSCGPKGNGSTCAQSSECASQHCVDSVCCNEACTDRCKACDLGTAAGTCGQVTSGPPHGTRSPCAGSGACAGSCTSASATACTYPGDEVTCRSASCAGATFTARAGCNAAGSCADPATTSCGDLVCNAAGTACLSTCTSDNQCATAARPYCDGGACVGGRANGARCQTAQECASHRCVDGFCCNDACQLPCQACDVSGRAGACSPVPGGTPYGGRAPCGGTGACAGSCAGLASGQCFFPGAEKSCVCPNGIGSGTCNAMGACETLPGLCL